MRIQRTTDWLLDDIMSPGVDCASAAPDGLEELTQLEWLHGTVLTRQVLEAAREGSDPCRGRDTDTQPAWTR